MDIDSDGFVETKQGLSFKPLWNWMNCPHRPYCPGREKREEKLIKHLCSYNPSIFECEAFIQYSNLNELIGFGKILDEDRL